MEIVKIDRRDFLNCLKALKHSERIFEDAIKRRDFPLGSSEEEISGFLEEIRGTKGKIEAILFQPPAEATN